MMAAVFPLGLEMIRQGALQNVENVYSELFERISIQVEKYFQNEEERLRKWNLELQQEQRVADRYKNADVVKIYHELESKYMGMLQHCKDLKKEKDEIQKKFEDTQKEKNDSEEKYEDTQNQKCDLEEKYENMQKEKDGLEEKYKHLQKEKDDLEEKYQKVMNDNKVTKKKCKVDMEKVNMDMIKPWIAKRITELIGIEDEVLIGYVFELLQETRFPDRKELQIVFTGFLNGKDARIFMRELWTHMLSAQENIGGIPADFLEKKTVEIRQRKDLQREKDTLEEKYEKVINENVVTEKTSQAVAEWMDGQENSACRVQKEEEQAMELESDFYTQKIEKTSRNQGVNLYIKYLEHGIDEERLIKEFSAFGSITSAKVIKDYETGQSKGYGFVCFSSHDEAREALRQMNGRILATRPLYVAFAISKEERWTHFSTQFMQRGPPLRDESSKRLQDVISQSNIDNDYRKFDNEDEYYVTTQPIIFDNCDLTDISLHNTVLDHDIRLTSCNLTNFQFNDCDWWEYNHYTFDGSDMDGSSFVDPSDDFIIMMTDHNNFSFKECKNIDNVLFDQDENKNQEIIDFIKTTFNL